MQIKDIVLDDMMGISGVKKYGSFFLSLQTDTLEKMSYIEDKEKIVQLKKLIRNILLFAESKNRDSLKEYDFMDLNTKKILVLSMYNAGPNAKDIKPGVLYAIAILA